MEGVLEGLPHEKCLIYFDDVLGLGQTYAEHLSNLHEVFTRLTAGLKLKPTKCHLKFHSWDMLCLLVEILQILSR